MRCPPALSLIAVASLTACGASAPDASSGSHRLQPTLQQSDVLGFDADVRRLSGAPRTAVSHLPSGTVTYAGQVGSNARVNGTPGFGILGDMRMNVEFSGNREISGSVSDVNMLRNGIPVERLGGTLNIDGDQASGKIRAGANGILSRSDGFGGTERTNMALQIDGVVRDDVFVGDAVEGRVSGFGDGYQLSGETFNVVLDGNGSFVGVVD